MHKYERIREAIEVMVAEAGPGARLPTEKELARRFDASAMTVRRALQVLSEAGQLYGVPGKGIFVARSRVTKVACVSTPSRRRCGLRDVGRAVDSSRQPCGRPWMRLSVTSLLLVRAGSLLRCVACALGMGSLSALRSLLLMRLYFLEFLGMISLDLCTS